MTQTIHTDFVFSTLLCLNFEFELKRSGEDVCIFWQMDGQRDGLTNGDTSIG